MSTGTAAFPRNQGPGSIQPSKLHGNIRRYSYCLFPSAGSFWALAGYGNPSGTAQVVNYGEFPCEIGGSLPIAYAALGTQTILAPTFAAAGVDWGMDQTDNDGSEVVFGGNTARGKHAFTIGTNPRGASGFFAQITTALQDVSGTDEYLFGFRKDQAFQAAHTSYTDYAAIGFFTSANPGLVQTKTRLNTGTAVLASTTQTKADGVAMTFRVDVDRDGRVTFGLDGSVPTVSQVFQFDTGDVVYPFLFRLHSTDVGGTFVDTFFECGYRDEKGV
jgi:hypothetical protein